MTSYTAVVMGATHAHASILSAQLVNIDARHQLLVTVFSDGSVIKHSLTPHFDVGFETCAEASRQLNALLIGTTLENTVQVPSRSDHVAQLVRDSVAALHAQQPTAEGEQLFIGGSSRVADSFDGVDTVRKVLAILEQELLVVSLVQDMLSRGLSVAIGSENGFEPLSTCAVVVAPVTIDGTPAGAVGLLGPTRMKYQETMTAAAAVSRHLARHFGGDEENANN